jgi:2,4-dienoyl-CoA reductase-like NADH-dependent reductase (Old Yellow Enzyme family)
MRKVLATASPYPDLFNRFELAGKPLKNRIVHAAILTALADKGRVTDKLVHYYANRAKGGAAMVVTEPIGALPRHQSSARVCAWNDSELSGLARLAESVEVHNCRILAQIQDPGRARHVGGRLTDAIGASPVADDLSWSMPRELSTSGIEEVIESFAQAAARLFRCGFSGIEISAGHGHLWHQFLSPWSNLREDHYGGDLVNRVRILDELVDAIRAATNSQFIIGMKLPGNDGVKGGIDIEESCRIAAHFAQVGNIHYLCPTQGSHGPSLETHMPNDQYPRVPYKAIFERLRAAVPNLPLMAVARITDPSEADQLVNSGQVDLVALGRALITDPAWPMKAASGKARDIRYCVAANNCWNTIVHQKPIACDNNPRVAQPDELEWQPPVALKHKSIVIVGTGIAGLEAAWIAASRGHRVVVMGKSDEVGGNTRRHAGLPYSESLSSIYDWQFNACQQAGVQFKLGAEATLESIVAHKPDEIILATGAQMSVPRCLPQTVMSEGLFSDIRHSLISIQAIKSMQTGSAVLFDMDQTEGTYAAAFLLAEKFSKVFLITPRDGVAQETPLVTRQKIQRTLFEKNIEVRYLSEPWFSPTFSDDAGIGSISVFGGSPSLIEDAVFFSWSSPRQPNSQLETKLLAAGILVHKIGDCRVAGPVMQATSDGNTIALKI